MAARDYSTSGLKERRISPGSRFGEIRLCKQEAVLLLFLVFIVTEKEVTEIIEIDWRHLCL